MALTSPSQLSRELRTATHPDLARRRSIIALSLLGAAIGGVVGAYQTGLIRRLPDPPVGPFDSERVDASDYAYKRLGVPDGLLMIITYSITAALAGAGGANRAHSAPLLPMALAAKTLYDAATTVKLTREEWAENSALCAYCQVAMLSSLASAALAMPEALRAARNWLR